MSHAVVITGQGCVTSLGETPDELFDALVARRSGIADGVGACPEFDAEQWMTPKEARRSDRFSHLALAATQQAWEQADPEGVEGDRVGVILGTGVGGLETMERNVIEFLQGGERAVSPMFVTMMMANAAAGLISMRHGIRGPGFALASACATGNHSIGEAARIIQRGEADVMVAGGSEAALTQVCIAAFKRMGALSREGRSCPFDARRDGFVLGEGAGVLVLEREDHARARGRAILGRIAGYGASNDAFHITQPDEEGRGAQLSMRNALRDADASPGDVGYVNAHGTSTPFNDRIETHALHQVFPHGPPPVSSTKSAIGHLLGAAGAVEAVISLQAITRSELPPTLNLEQPDPDCDLDYVPDGPREAPGLKLVLSNAFAFGGTNATLLLAAA